ncbi:hypothetical protein TNCV_4678131 [Trichonephila clavipes]|nr:hypothetical protein TNCV_4678131 [Trichonephila clavipes]
MFLESRTVNSVALPLILRQPTNRHPVSQRKTCPTGCITDSNRYTTLTLVFHTFYQDPYQLLRQQHPLLKQLLLPLKLVIELQLCV